QLSGGRFDPALYPLIETWRRALEKKEAPSPPALQKGGDASGWSHLSLKEGELWKDHPDAGLDLSSLMKGVTVDWIAEELLAKGYSDFFIDWGGKMRARGAPPNAPFWKVPIDPRLTLEGRPLAPFALKNG